MNAARGRALGSFIAAGVFGTATVAAYFLWPTADQESASERTGEVAVAPWTSHGAHGVEVRLDF